MNKDIRDRVVLPIAIPLGAIVITEVIVFSLSRILLTAGRTPAVLVALGASLAVLLGSAAVASARRLKTSSIVALLVIVGLGVVFAGAWAADRGPTFPEKHGAEGTTIEVSAEALAFSTSSLELEAGAETTIHFANLDSAPHNIAIYTDESLSRPLLRGDIIDPGSKTTYDVKALEAGTYYFQCDVHPVMKGDVTVA